MRHPHERRRRAGGALAVTFGLLGLLGFAFFRAQVLRSSVYRLQAESNRLRPLPVPAPRGTIFDRNGRVIADNVPGYAVTVLYDRRDEAEATLERLAPILGLDSADIATHMTTVDRYYRQPLVVDADADFEAVSQLEERRAQFPNVFIEMRPKRSYAAGEAVYHAIGYIGEITSAQLDQDAYAGYQPGMLVGLRGIEQQYERSLQGTRGIRYVEVDARGRVVGDFRGSEVHPGSPGTDLHLNLDVDLQEWIHRIFPPDLAGAVVALDPADGGVLALYSAPTVDANAFVGGISSELWASLNQDPRRPLFNRAVSSSMAPASTFKPVVAAMALDMGLVTLEDHMPTACDGGLSYGGRYWRCWDPSGHGDVNLLEAIGNSCDVYFYQLGLRVGLDPFIQRGIDLGLTRACGIDLPDERPGDFPEGRGYWERVWGYRAQEGEVLSLAIGQGPIAQTPLKMAQFYLALARDGSAPAPSLLRDRRDAPEGWELELDPSHLDALREGLAYVTGPDGTAHMSSLEHWTFIGKTGTGETRRSQSGAVETDAWFAGMAGPRGGPPEIVVVALVEQGGGGSRVAAPIAAKAADFFLRRQHGIPLDTIQTLGEHLRAGRPAPWAVWR